MNRSISYTGSGYSCATKTVRISIFTVKAWTCPPTIPFFNMTTSMCEDICLVYQYGNEIGQYCEPCSFACYSCTNGVSAGCTTCNPADFRELVSTQCQCISGYYPNPSGSTVCVTCSSQMTNCATC